MRLAGTCPTVTAIRRDPPAPARKVDVRLPGKGNSKSNSLPHRDCHPHAPPPPCRDGYSVFLPDGYSVCTRLSRRVQRLGVNAMQGRVSGF